MGIKINTVAIASDKIVIPSSCGVPLITKVQSIAHSSSIHTIWKLVKGFLFFISYFFRS